VEQASLPALVPVIKLNTLKGVSMRAKPAFAGYYMRVSIYYLWRPNLKDEADNHLIELAVAGNAQIIATHNLKDFQNSELLFPNLSILKPEEIIRS
jgi:predicted nucleic acid-binding protein